jgi:hypothetical protein
MLVMLAKLRRLLGTEPKLEPNGGPPREDDFARAKRLAAERKLEQEIEQRLGRIQDEYDVLRREGP